MIMSEGTPSSSSMTADLHKANKRSRGACMNYAAIVSQSLRRRIIHPFMTTTAGKKGAPMKDSSFFIATVSLPRPFENIFCTLKLNRLSLVASHSLSSSRNDGNNSSRLDRHANSNSFSCDIGRCAVAVWDVHELSMAPLLNHSFGQTSNHASSSPPSLGRGKMYSRDLRS